MNILGISCLYHDSAAALLRDGEIVAAAQEERFTRVKHDWRVPENAIKYCLREGNITGDEVDYIVYYDKPFLTLDRYVKNIIALGRGERDVLKNMCDSILGEKLWIHEKLRNSIGGLGKNGKLLICGHHISHASSAFFPSPYTDAVIITNDGVGEWATTTIGVGHGNKVKIYKEIDYPHSIGLLYSAFTYYCGFKVNSGDYKFMGLAPYGSPIYYDIIKKNLIDIKEDGSYRMNMGYFDYQNGRTMIRDAKFEELLGYPRRRAESNISKFYMDIAASVQKLIEEIIISMARHAKKEYGQGIDNLVLAGGVALNCVANGKLLDEKIFDNIWVQPAAGDAGGALGAAEYLYYDYLGNERNVGKSDLQRGSYLGKSYSLKEIESYLKWNKYPFYYIENDEAFFNYIAKMISEEKVIGLFHGRMEFGPRALGNRSIIADARSKEMQSKLNLKIKFRESFRPFAPSVLRERASDYFELNEGQESPYMLLVEKVKPERRVDFVLSDYLNEYNDNLLSIVNRARADIPAVTHVDYSARIQTVDEERNLFYYNILKSFERMTGCGVIVNTSFNVRGEPIVCSPKEAYECFMRTDMDILVLERFILLKEEQPQFIEKEDWRDKYELD